MGFKIQIESRRAYLLVTLSGVLRSVDEAVCIAEQAIPAAQDGGYSRILQDERKLNVVMDVYDTMLAADQTGDFAPWSGIRVASLRSDRNWEIGKITETMLQNRSIIFKVFKDVDAAIDWLQSEG